MSRQEEAFNFQNKISSLFNNGLQTAIENVLDEMSPHNEVIRIDKLKLDLGAIDAQNFEKEFKDKFVTALKKAVQAGKSEGAGNGNVVVTAQSQSHAEAVVYFLEHGTLPWYSNIKSIPAWEEEISEQWQQADWRNVLQWIKTHHTALPYIVQRVVLQFSDRFLERLVVELLFSNNFLASLPGKPTWIDLYSDVSHLAARISALRPSIARNKIWLDIFNIYFDEKDLDDVSHNIVRLVMMQLQVPAPLQTEVVVHKKELLQNSKTVVVKNILKRIIHAIEHGIPLKNLDSVTNWKHVISGNTNESGVEYTTKGTRQDDDFIDAEYLDTGNEEENHYSEEKNKIQTPEKTKPVVKKGRAEKPEQVTYVNNCGIVLLHPFLSAYLKDVGLVEEKKFVNEEAQQRAVLLLYYLATGETEAPEFNLVLQKNLCGLASEDTIAAGIELTPKETEESANLLRAVIDYWPPLKNTSITGFQSTFLRREGRLSETDNGWLLRVDQKTVDILLGKLPWGFSTIHLPWMQKVLNVEWG